VHHIERPATGSYALVSVENNQKGAGHVDEKSVSGKGVYQLTKTRAGLARVRLTAK
jgi:hypothetical protein